MPAASSAAAWGHTKRMNAALPGLGSEKGKHPLSAPMEWCISSAAAKEGTKGALNHLLFLVGLDLDTFSFPA